MYITIYKLQKLLYSINLKLSINNKRVAINLLENIEYFMLYDSTFMLVLVYKHYAIGYYLKLYQNKIFNVLGIMFIFDFIVCN